MGLAARVLEERGIATVVFSQRMRFSQLTRPPRLLVVNDTPIGFPLGEPGDRPRQLALVRQALSFLRRASAGEVAHV